MFSLTDTETMQCASLDPTLRELVNLRLKQLRLHIGGYQPAQKWLKDRRGRKLSWDDIGHYQRIIKILAETGRIMKEIKFVS